MLKTRLMPATKRRLPTPREKCLLPTTSVESHQQWLLTPTTTRKTKAQTSPHQRHSPKRALSHSRHLANKIRHSQRGNSTRLRLQMLSRSTFMRLKRRQHKFKMALCPDLHHTCRKVVQVKRAIVPKLQARSKSVQIQPARRESQVLKQAKTLQIPHRKTKTAAIANANHTTRPPWPTHQTTSATISQAILRLSKLREPTARSN